MYEQHQKKLDKLQDIREKEAMDEQKRLQDAGPRRAGSFEQELIEFKCTKK